MILEDNGFSSQSDVIAAAQEAEQIDQELFGEPQFADRYEELE